MTNLFVTRKAQKYVEEALTHFTNRPMIFDEWIFLARSEARNDKCNNKTIDDEIKKIVKEYEIYIKKLHNHNQKRKI